MNIERRHHSFLIMNFCLLFFAGCVEKHNSGGQIESIIVEKFNSGKVKLEKFKVKSDSSNFLCKQYFENGKVAAEYHMKDTMLQGYSKYYSENGTIISEGNWVANKKIGNFKFYDLNGRLNKIIKYINYRDSAISKPNQTINFSPNGDTLLNGSSIFYDFYSVGDTIKNGKEYEFKIVLRGHKFEKAHIRFCDFDDKFNLTSEQSCEGAEMLNFETHLTLKKYHLGANTIRGVIINYDLNSDKSEIGKYAEIYFEDKFYVIP